MRVSLYVHGSKESAWDAAIAAGLSEEAQRAARFLGMEHKMTYEVDPETGVGELVAVDDREITPPSEVAPIPPASTTPAPRRLWVVDGVVFESQAAAYSRAEHLIRDGNDVAILQVSETRSTLERFAEWLVCEHGIEGVASVITQFLEAERGE